MERIIENNQVILSGTVGSNLEYSHSVFGEKFYFFKLNVQRNSGEIDSLPIIISERTIAIEDYTNCNIRISGQYRSFNQKDENNNTTKLKLYVFAKEIEFTDYNNYDIDNMIYLEGYICKPPVFRTTPLGKEITDILLAVNRPYGKSDYIPCITWGRNARYTAELPIGTNIKAKGRLQSRQYMKNNDVYEVYEVSMNQLEIISNETEGEIND